MPMSVTLARSLFSPSPLLFFLLVFALCFETCACVWAWPVCADDRLGRLLRYVWPWFKVFAQPAFILPRPRSHLWQLQLRRSPDIFLSGSWLLSCSCIFLFPSPVCFACSSRLAFRPVASIFRPADGLLLRVRGDCSHGCFFCL